MTRTEIFEHLESIHVAKVYIMFSYENNELNIISNIIITTDGKYSVDWSHDVYSDTSYITEPIRNFDKSNCDSMDGLLTWNILNKKVIISGEKFRTTKEKFSEEI